MWMIWSLNALLASTYDPRRVEIQVVLLATMFGALVLVVAALPSVLLLPPAVTVVAALILAGIAVADGRFHKRGAETNPTL
jgi:low temperature requirement protein LtrA